jgi:hypothetical protein
MNIADVTIAGVSIGLSVRLRAIARHAANETPPTPEKDCSKVAREGYEKGGCPKWPFFFNEISIF